MESFEAFERAVQSTAGIVKQVEPAQMEGATPCTEWTVRALLNHIIGTLWLSHDLFADKPPEHAAGPGALPAEDLVGDDPAASYAAAAAAALASVGQDGALAAPHQTPLGEMPGPVLAGFTTLDVFVHGWDLAQATGQEADFDPELAAHVLEFAMQAFTEETRQFNIGPAVAVSEDAPVLDRLVAYLGRQP